MFRIHRIAAIAVAFSLAGGAFAADSKIEKKDEGRICTLETSVGSHMPKRVCTTAAEREAARANARDHMSKYQDFANRTSISGSPKN